MSTYKLVLTGSSMSETDLVRFITHAKAQGFDVTTIKLPDDPATLPEPTWTDDELRLVDPCSELTHMYTSANNKKWLAAVHVLTAYDLTQLTFEAFLEPYRGVAQQAMRLKGEVLEFMIRHRIRFADLDPAAAFPTHVEQTDLSVRTTNPLQRDGIKRLGVLAYFTAKQLQDGIRNFGPTNISEIRRELARYSLALKGE